MSFSRLLAAGRSMVGMSDAHSPYRMREENLLPKFESKKNPFASSTKNEACKAPVQNPFSADNSGSQLQCDCAAEAAPVGTGVAAAPRAPKVAPMETYPLFDAQLNPVVACATAGAQAVPARSGSEIPVSFADVEVPVPVAVATAKRDASRSATPAETAAKTTFAQRRLPVREVHVGLVDASPLGLKTGAERETLPAPVVVPAKAPAKQPASSAAPEKPASDPASEPSQVVAALAPKQGQKSGWLSSLFNLLRRGKPAQPAAPRKAVQTELSLDQVKVVRNDLNDTDLEVVTIRRSEKPAATPPVRLEPLGPSEPGSLSRLASRIFGAGEPLVR